MYLPQCMNCRHFQRFSKTEKRQGICAAFPDGIPGPIMDNEEDHRQPVAGDRGLRWEQVDPQVPHPLALAQERVA